MKNGKYCMINILSDINCCLYNFFLEIKNKYKKITTNVNCFLSNFILKTKTEYKKAVIKIYKKKAIKYYDKSQKKITKFTTKIHKLRKNQFYFNDNFLEKKNLVFKGENTYRKLI